jgi:nicotinate-nucleotide pyrophosphorylase (carboxylating)
MASVLDEEITRITAAALSEDLGAAGDITSTALFGADDRAEAVIRSKAAGVLSGTALIEPVFARCTGAPAARLLMHDGETLEAGSVICTVEGPVCGILAAERTILNILQRLSGIATLTSRYVAAIAGTGARLLDTRKTTPGLRMLEKQAVLHGGGCNHRVGLFDMILIKDTHVKRSGGVAQALSRAFSWRRDNGSSVAIEVEVQSEEEFAVALAMRPDRIMLDNMSVDMMRRCVERRNAAERSIELEASGNVTLGTIRTVAETGVDFISVGALTHSAPALDIHLLIQ